MNKNMEDIVINPNMNLGAQSPLEMQGELYENETNEKAKSKSQQRFFGMVDAYKKGELKNASKSVKDAASGMSMKQVKDFAKTKHKGLPNHVDESYMSTQDNQDIKEFKSFIMQNPELPRYPNSILLQYRDVCTNIYNMLPSDITQESYRYLCDVYTHLKRGDMHEANYCYVKSIQCLVDALNKSNLYENKGKMKKNKFIIKESQLREIIKECIQQHLVDVLGKYTQGKATSKQANKAIMDFANSSNTTKKSKVNESDAWMPDDMAPYNEQESNLNTVNYVFETIPFIFACMQDNNEMEEIEFMKQHINELSTLPKQIIYWMQYSYDMEKDPDDIANAYETNENIVEEELSFKLGTNEIPVSTWLQQNKEMFSPEILQEIDYTLKAPLQFSTLGEVQGFMGKIKRLINNQQPLNESYEKGLNFDHFAVNKKTNKIVNGWEYKSEGISEDELNAYRKDYFDNDLEENGLNPKNYSILTVSGCKRRGIDPFDKSNWTNDDYFNAYTQPMY